MTMPKRPRTEDLVSSVQPAKKERRTNVSAQRSTQQSPTASQDGTHDGLPIWDCFRIAWERLKQKEPDRMDFRKREILSLFHEVFNEHWKGDPKLKPRFDFRPYFKKNGMFKKVDSDDVPSDIFIMVDPSFVPSRIARARDAKAKEAAAKAKDIATQKDKDVNKESRQTKSKDSPATNDAPSGNKYVVGKRSGKKAPIPPNGLIPLDDDDEEQATEDTVNEIPKGLLTEYFKPVRLSKCDKAVAIAFEGDNDTFHTVRGYKGFRMVRATSGVMEGSWYFEVHVLKFNRGHVRLGWGTRHSDVETPVGFDAYGFSYRDLTGEFVNRGRPKPYGQSYGQGDVIGCRIKLPNLTEDQKKNIAETDMAWLHFKHVSLGQGPRPDDSRLDVTPHAEVEFFKNGKSMGIPPLFTAAREKHKADEKMSDAKQGEVVRKSEHPTEKLGMTGGVYYPSIALFQNALVRVNFGPDFQYPIPSDCQPMSEAARDAPPEEKESNAENKKDATVPKSDSACEPNPGPSQMEGITTSKENGKETSNQIGLNISQERSPTGADETAASEVVAPDRNAPSQRENDENGSPRGGINGGPVSD